ncbi:MAG: hypothetical protein R3B09_05745 [Nannocystaceae bacterium]
MHPSNCARVTFALAALVAVSPALGGCDTAPFDGTVYSTGNTDRVITFAGYGTHSLGPIVLEVKEQDTGNWVVFAATTTQEDPAANAGLWLGSPALYAWTVNAQIVANAGQLNRWQPGTTAKVRARQFNYNGGWDALPGYGSAAELSCMLQATGDDYTESYDNCVPENHSILELVDIE